MHDLEIIYPLGPRAAVEVTAAAYSEAIELWNLMNGKGRWLDESLVGGWIVSLFPSARANRIRKELPTLLRELERLGIRQLPPRWHASASLQDVATALGVINAVQSGTDYPGSIYVTLELPSEQVGGFVPTSGTPLVTWLEAFLLEQRCADLLSKLSRSEAEERHAFIFVPGFSGAPFEVSDLLMRPDAPVPDNPPRLPPEITHVWIAGTWDTGNGFRWSPRRGWHRFDTSPTP